MKTIPNGSNSIGNALRNSGGLPLLMLLLALAACSGSQPRGATSFPAATPGWVFSSEWSTTHITGIGASRSFVSKEQAEKIACARALHNLNCNLKARVISVGVGVSFDETDFDQNTTAVDPLLAPEYLGVPGVKILELWSDPQTGDAFCLAGVHALNQSACSRMAAQINDASGSDRRPDWVDNIPQAEGAVFSVGMSQGQYSGFWDALEIALSNGLGQMAESKQIKVSSMKDYSETGHVGSRVNSASETVGPVHVLNVWSDPLDGRVMTLLCWERNRY